MGGGVEIRRCVSVLNMLRYKIINSGFKVCSKQTCNAKTCTPLHTNEYFLQRQKMISLIGKKIIKKGTRINETIPGNWSK